MHMTLKDGAALFDNRSNQATTPDPKTNPAPDRDEPHTVTGGRTLFDRLHPTRKDNA